MERLGSDVDPPRPETNRVDLAAQPVCQLDEGDAEALLGESSSGDQSGHPTSHDDDTVRAVRLGH
jgi:hypothetical protein